MLLMCSCTQKQEFKFGIWNVDAAFTTQTAMWDAEITCMAAKRMMKMTARMTMINFMMKDPRISLSSG